MSKMNDRKSSEGLEVCKLQSLVRLYIDKHQYESAHFWADKLVSLSDDEIADIYWLAQTLYLTGQYHRAAHLLQSKKLNKANKACQYLTAKCHAAVKEWEEALNVLDASESSIKTPGKVKEEDLTSPGVDIQDIPLQNVESSICLLRGQVYEAMENRVLAAENYRLALQQDPYCFEAFELLVKHQMLTANEERTLLDSLPLTKNCRLAEMEVVKSVYETILKKYDKPSLSSLPSCLEPLKDNSDVVTCLAERHYYNCDFRTCHKITSEVLNKDPYHGTCLPLHIATLVELRKSNDLFYLAHKLVDLYPGKPISWFAVGCYYYLVGKNDSARRFFSKATTLDRLYGPAWLAFGHSFAAEGEHDQAMAAYFTASQLMKGCHLPLLFVGLEYGLTKNFKLAEKFFDQALAIAPSDPFVLHEMGVVEFHNGDWDEAEKYFVKALAIVQSMGTQDVPEKWEPLLNNLGHVSRKLKKYEEALEFHRQALVLCPHSPSSYSAIGYVYSLMGDFAMAIDYFHKALGLGRRYVFSETMLARVIEQFILETSPSDGGSVDISELTSPAAPKDDVMILMKDDTSSSLDIEVEMEDND
ncbi:cell division cycle protein 16 homolog [Patiria miniata]|uniref:Cell division cycle protein 16 homolog n=1 Tax=Patiria miniata TaxID=46514 RepID=A0A913ZFQ8_PATMI|nr:cell division cycle protein 16 homolog [Patiria miniata]